MTELGDTAPRILLNDEKKAQRQTHTDAEIAGAAAKGNSKKVKPKGMPINKASYLELVDGLFIRIRFLASKEM